MGTRADFYIGNGPEAEWLGSVARDGYEWDDKESVLAKATTAEEFRAAVQQIASERKDWTSPERGWPWPWENSGTTDYAYMFIDGACKASVFGGALLALGVERDEESEGDSPDFPDMSARQNVRFDEGSGAIFVST